MENKYNLSVVEALILASPEPLPARKIADAIEGMSARKVGQAVAELNNRYMSVGCSFRIRELAGGYQFYIIPEYTSFVEELFARRRKMRLTRAALETVAIVAYRQPVTKTEIEHIRGVSSDGVIHTLLEKKLITIRGRANTLGRPLQYGTTQEFLKFFGLATLEDLPKMSEIEELLRSSESEHQAQLSLDPVALDAQTQQKLNVADGTFDPKSRQEDEDSETAAELTEQVEPQDPTDSTESTESGETVDNELPASNTNSDAPPEVVEEQEHEEETSDEIISAGTSE